MHAVEGNLEDDLAPIPNAARYWGRVPPRRQGTDPLSRAGFPYGREDTAKNASADRSQAAAAPASRWIPADPGV